MIYTHSVLFLRTNIGDSHIGRRLLGKCSSRDSYLHFTGTSPIQWQCNMNYLLWWLMARPSGELAHPPPKHYPTILFGPIENMGLLHLPLPQFFKVQPWTNCYKALAIEQASWVNIPSPKHRGCWHEQGLVELHPSHQWWKAPKTLIFLHY